MKIANNTRYHTDDLQRIVDHIINKHCVHPIQLGWGLSRYYKSIDEITLVFAEHSAAGHRRWDGNSNVRSYVRRMTYAQAHRVMLLAPDYVLENKIAVLTQPMDSEGYCEAPSELVEELVENLLYRLDGQHRTASRTTAKPNFADPVYRLRFRYGGKPKSTPEAKEADRLVVRRRMDAEVQYRARQAVFALDKMRAALHTYNKKQRPGEEASPRLAALNTIWEELEAVENALELVRGK